MFKPDFECNDVGTAARLQLLEAEVGKDRPTVGDFVAGIQSRLVERIGCRQDALALTILLWVEDACGPFGSVGFDWSADAGKAAVSEYFADGGEEAAA